MVFAIISDGLISGKIKVTKYSENFAGLLIGSVFLVYSMPLIGMAYIQFYIFSGVSGYDLLPDFAETLGMILGVTAIPGGVIGWFAIRIAKKRISIPVKTVMQDKSE